MTQTLGTFVSFFGDFLCVWPWERAGMVLHRVQCTDLGTMLLVPLLVLPFGVAYVEPLSSKKYSSFGGSR